MSQLQSSYDVTIFGASLASGYLAVWLARLGIRVLVVISQPKLYFYPKHVIPVLDRPFVNAGLPVPLWPCEWLNSRLSGLVKNKKLQSCLGVLLDLDQAISGMLKDALHCGADIAYGLTIKDWESQWDKLTLSDQTVVACHLLVQTESPPLQEEPTLNYVGQAFVEGIPMTSGLIEMIEEKLLLLPVGNNQLCVFYKQADATNRQREIQGVLQARFPGQRFKVIAYHLTPYPVHPIRLPYADRILRVASHGLGNWGFQAEQEWMMATYCAEQIACYLLSDHPGELDRINAYVERFYPH